MQGEQPFVTWCLALEYLQRCLRGAAPEGEGDTLLKALMGRQLEHTKVKRSNPVWEQAVTGLQNTSAAYVQANSLLLSGANTIMGVIGDSAPGTAKIYRYHELCNSLAHLQKKGWDVSDELGAYQNYKLYANTVKLLSDLYGKVARVAQEEQELAQETVAQLTWIAGEPPTEDSLMDLVGEIQRFYAQCRQSNQVYRTELEMQFSGEPKELAHRMMTLFETVREGAKITNPIEIIARFSSDPVAQLKEYSSGLQKIAEFADVVKRQFQKLAGNDQTAVDTDTARAVMDELDYILEITENLEVRPC